MAREIPLTQGHVALIDDEDCEKVAAFKWHAFEHGQTVYARTNVQSGRPRSGRTGLYMHRLILDAGRGQQVDHKDGNGLDNRKANLRLVTKGQNGQNLHVPKTSQYPGVSWFKPTGTWRAVLHPGNQYLHLGLFPTEEDAFRAYCAAVQSHGRELLPEWRATLATLEYGMDNAA